MRSFNNRKTKNMKERTEAQTNKHAVAIATIAALLLLAVVVAPASASPLEIFEVSAGNVTATSAVITWTTDEPGNSTVNYGATTSLDFTASDGDFVTNHTVNLSGLNPGTLYYYEVSSTSEAGNITLTDNNSGVYYTFHTPPVITDVQTTDIKTGSATITWATDVPATSVVNYGETTGLGLTASDSTLLTSHSIALSELKQHTIYYYEVKSTDGEGNTVTDDNVGACYTFTTQGPIEELATGIGPLIVSTLTLTSNILGHFVDFDSGAPLTIRGTNLLNLLAQIFTVFAKGLARILAFAH